jgi:hypothetical protein
LLRFPARLVGEGDEPTPPELAREIVAGIGDRVSLWSPTVAICHRLEQPTAVTKALVEWLKL